MTAEEFINTNIKVNEYPLVMEKATLLMVAFAKLHVEAALKAASENAHITFYAERARDPWQVNEKSILNAYPLINIK